MDTFLGRALMDHATGLPNIPYFCLIQSWEERRARRRKTRVRVLRLQVMSGGDEIRRALMVRLCQELRTSDLIASEGKSEFRILLTTPDAENAAAIAERIDGLAGGLNELHGSGDHIMVQVEMEPTPVSVSDEIGPCEPCDEPAAW